jgi:predicted NodU family carbamoyl transferase
MKDGYYLSTYAEINKIACLYDFGERHDQNISLWNKKGNMVTLIHYWELERLTGEKEHRRSFFNKEHLTDFLNGLLKKYDLTLCDMVEIWGTPQLSTDDNYHSIKDYPEITYHSISHLFSSLMMDTDIFYNENILGLSVDGGPDQVADKNSYNKYFYAGCVSIGGKIEIFPIASPGAIWDAAAKHYKIKEGTLMALAHASKSAAFLPDEEPIMTMTKDSSEALNFLYRLIKNIDEITTNDTGILFNGFDQQFTQEENKISMVMKCVNQMSINIMEKNIENILEKHKINPQNTYLSLSGGFALNCPTNSHLMDKYKFKGFIAPPCVNDGGLSMGTALYAFYKKADHFSFKLSHAYYGDWDDSLDRMLENGKYKEFIMDVSEYKADQAVQDIIDAPVVWFNDRSELGPRALANRSILADPRQLKSKDRLNEIKQRQWWRPVAPIVLEEDVNQWFDNAYNSEFMLHIFSLVESKAALLPAISHLDDTSRIQTVNEKINPDIYNLIKSFKNKTGIPMICNTSLNDRGEPIINKIEEAFHFSLVKGIKVLYINKKRIVIQNHHDYIHCAKNTYTRIDTKLSEDLQEKQKKLINPLDVPKDILIFYDSMGLQSKYNLTKKADVEKLKSYYKRCFSLIDKKV